MHFELKLLAEMNVYCYLRDIFVLHFVVSYEDCNLQILYEWELSPPVSVNDRGTYTAE